MSGVGFSELIILFLIGLIVLGPERLPRVANQLGNWIGQARRMTRVMKRQLEDELDLENTHDIRPPRPAEAPFEEDAGMPDPAPAQIPANEDDDLFSAAHEADDIGTGVGDNDGIETEDMPADDQDEAPDKGKHSAEDDAVRTP